MMAGRHEGGAIGERLAGWLSDGRVPLSICLLSGVEGLGIGDRDLEEASGTVKEEEGEEEEGSSRGGGRR